METPEKLYIWFGLPYTVDYTKLNKRRDEEEVEYTRTDAFIKKVCEWLAARYDKKGSLDPNDIEDLRKEMEE